MSQTISADTVGRRAELLARVALTRRLNVDVLPFDEKRDAGIDFIGVIRNDEVKGFLPFAVVVWGTAKQLDSEREANLFGRQKPSITKRGQFFMPVVALLFSMHQDEAFYAWLVEPSKDTTKLLNAEVPTFKTFDGREFDKMISRIVKWYHRLQERVVDGTAPGDE
jgi:hypothetical protein